MNILVTGGCGFIGSNFIHSILKSHNHKILNFDKLTYSGNVNNHADIIENNNYSFIQGDICDIKALTIAINNFQPTYIINFAAESHVDRSIDNPMSFINTNILGTATLLQACTSYQKKLNHSNFKFLHISTDEVFGSLTNEGSFTELSPYNPSSPYSASKASSDHLVRAWQHTYGLSTLITNCSNNYGPYQFPEKLIPLMIVNCLDNKPLPVYGKGQNIRDWLYVEDHCNAIAKVLFEGKVGETYNIGGNNEIKNIDIVNIICSALDKLKPRINGEAYSSLIHYVDDRPGHDFRYAINCSKILHDINWVPLESFESGIIKTINWYLENEPWWRSIQKNNYSQKRLGLKP